MYDSCGSVVGEEGEGDVGGRSEKRWKRKWKNCGLEESGEWGNGLR